MNILHICGDYGKVHEGLFEKQVLIGLSIEAFCFTTRRIIRVPENMYSKKFIKFYNSNISLLRTPLFFRTRINHVAEYFINYLEHKGKPDIVHAHMLFTDGELALRVYKRWKVPYIVVIRNTDLFSWYYWNIPWNKKRGLEILKNAQKVIFLGPKYIDNLGRKLPSKLFKYVGKNSLVIPNGIDCFWLENEPNKCPKKLSRPIQLITVGDICRNKNQITVIRAMDILKKMGYDLEYVLVGKIKDNKYAKNIINKPSVIYEGYCTKEELITRYRNANIFILISLRESFGLVYAEALSQGLPVIYSKSQGFDNQYEQGYIGFAADNKSPYELSQTIVRVIANYERMVDRSIAASKKFNWYNIANQYKNLYEEVVRKLPH